MNRMMEMITFYVIAAYDGEDKTQAHGLVGLTNNASAQTNNASAQTMSQKAKGHVPPRPEFQARLETANPALENQSRRPTVWVPRAYEACVPPLVPPTDQFYSSFRGRGAISSTSPLPKCSTRMYCRAIVDLHPFLWFSHSQTFNFQNSEIVFRNLIGT